jgi:hypothetical protein
VLRGTLAADERDLDRFTARLREATAALLGPAGAELVQAALKRARQIADFDEILKVAALLYHDPTTHAALGNPFKVWRLLGGLQEVGATDQVTALSERLPAAGLFDLFMHIGDHKVRFRFGREADTTAAAPWEWEDLE